MLRINFKFSCHTEVLIPKIVHNIGVKRVKVYFLLGTFRATTEFFGIDSVKSQKLANIIFDFLSFMRKKISVYIDLYRQPFFAKKR